MRRSGRVAKLNEGSEPEIGLLPNVGIVSPYENPYRLYLVSTLAL